MLVCQQSSNNKSVRSSVCACLPISSLPHLFIPRRLLFTSIVPFFLFIRHLCCIVDIADIGNLFSFAATTSTATKVGYASTHGAHCQDAP
jgi:hypothetical protein